MLHLHQLFTETHILMVWNASIPNAESNHFRIRSKFLFLQHFWRLQGVRASSVQFRIFSRWFSVLRSFIKHGSVDSIGEMLRHHLRPWSTRSRRLRAASPPHDSDPGFSCSLSRRLSMSEVWSVIQKSPADWIGSNQSAQSFRSLFEMESNQKQQHITCFSWTTKDWPCFEQVQKIESTKHEVHPEPWNYWWEWIVSLLISWKWN